MPKMDPMHSSGFKSAFQRWETENQQLAAEIERQKLLSDSKDLLTIYQGRPAGFDPMGKYSTSWSLDPEFARNYAGPGGKIYSQQVHPLEWGAMVRQTWSEGATTAAGYRASSVGIEEGRMPEGRIGQRFAASASLYQGPTLSPPSPQQEIFSTSMPSADIQAPARVEGARTGLLSRLSDAGQGGKQAEMQTGAVAGVVGGPRNVADTLNLGVSDRSRSAALPFKPQRPSEPFSEQLTHGMRGILQWGGITGADPIVGHGQAVRETPGYVNMEFSSVTGGGVTVPAAITERLQQTAVGALGEAGQRFGGLSDPLARAINVRDHVYKSVMGVVDNLEKQAKAEAAGGNLEAAQKTRELAQRARVIATDMVSSGLSAIENELGPGGKGLVFDLAKGMKMGPKGLSELLASDAISDTARAQIRQQAAEADNATFGKRQTFTFETSGGGTGSIGFDPGMREGGQGGQGGRGGIWGEGMGPLMYGAYIARRFWGYTGAPVMQATEQYAQTMGELAPIATGQIQTQGPGALYARRERAQFMLGAAGYNIFGGMLGLGSEAMATPVGSTLAAAGGIAAGLGTAGTILGAAAKNLPDMSVFGRAVSGQALGGAIGAAGQIGGIAALGMGGLALGGLAYGELFGQQLSAMETVQMANQSIGRAVTAPGLFIGAQVAKLTGTEDAFAKDTARIIRERGLDEKIGTQAGSGLASAAQISKAAAGLGMAEKEMPEVMAAAYQATGSRDWFSGRNPQYMRALTELMKTEGMSAGGAAAALGGYASALGYRPGEAGFSQAGQAYETMSVTERAYATEGAQRRAGMAGMARQYVSEAEISQPQLTAMMGYYGTQQRAQIGIQTAGQLTGAGMGGRQAQWAGISLMGGVEQGLYTANQAAGAGQLMGMMADYIPTASLNQYGAGMLTGMAGMSVDQQNIMGRIMGGDLRALSYASNVGMAPSNMAMYDISGNPLSQTNLAAGLNNLASLSAGIANGPAMGASAMANLPAYGKIQQFQALTASTMSAPVAGGFQEGAGFTPGMPNGTALGQTYGVSQEMQDFFNANPQAGLRDYQANFNNKMYGYQMAGIGIAQQRIDLQREFQWGGGDWRNPTAGSLWGIEDRMRALQWQGQQAQFQFSREMMETQNQFAVRQDDLTGRRMGVTQDYQRWGFGFERAGMDLSRQFTVENRQYQDQLRSMQQGYTLEDLDENIRMSSGRQRRQLVKQRDRFVSTTNVQEEAIDKQREQQDELWAREDEQFEKRKEYAESLMTLDEEQYSLNIERRETMYEMNKEELERQIELATKLHKLQDEQIEKQREYTVKQLELSEAALGVQAAAAAEQKKYNDDMLKLVQPMDDVAGSVETISNAEGVVNVLNAMVAMSKALESSGTNEVTAITGMVKAIGSVSTSKVNEIVRAFSILRNASNYRYSVGH